VQKLIYISTSKYIMLAGKERIGKKQQINEHLRSCGLAFGVMLIKPRFRRTTSL
jgi:hypothetical protein